MTVFEVAEDNYKFTGHLKEEKQPNLKYLLLAKK